jgi:glycosyltransferase involved in cell wall biosynthesis
MNTIYVVSLEPIETRYTVDWFDYIPKRLFDYIFTNNLPHQVINIGGFGKNIADEPTEGAFLNFAETNIWKNDQLNFIADRFKKRLIKSGDKFIFTDAWNPGIIQLRYMSSLLDIPVEIHSIWHAGSYDPWDFLGRKFDKYWSFDFEKSLFFASDKNYFATEYHADLFRRRLRIDYENYFLDRGIVCGFPFDYLKDRIKYDGRPKKDLILFPHRISPEKQPEIFRDLAASLPQYEFVLCQDKKLTKAEYYELMLDAKMVFSANLQETLGISMYEGYLARAIPMLPDRLSYSEIWNIGYPENWTEDWDSYQQYKQELITQIRAVMDKYTILQDTIFNSSQDKKLEEYFSLDKFIQCIFNAN